MDKEKAIKELENIQKDINALEIIRNHLTTKEKELQNIILQYDKNYFD